MMPMGMCFTIDAIPWVFSVLFCSLFSQKPIAKNKPELCIKIELFIYIHG